MWVNKKTNTVIVVEISKDDEPMGSVSRRYVSNYPAALAYVKSCCGGKPFDITCFTEDSFECVCESTRYWILEETIDNYYDIRDEYPDAGL